MFSTPAGRRSGHVTRTPYGLAMPPAMIDRLIEDRKTAQARAHQSATLFDHGGDRKTVPTQQQAALFDDHGADESDSAFQGAVRTLKRGSESADYLTARIARDHPDILDRMKQGEFPSVRAAAKKEPSPGRCGRPCMRVAGVRVATVYPRHQTRGGAFGDVRSAACLKKDGARLT